MWTVGAFVKHNDDTKKVTKMPGIRKQSRAYHVYVKVFVKKKELSRQVTICRPKGLRMWT